MATRIITDSGIDLDPGESAPFGIIVVPVHVRFGAQSLRDGYDIDRATFNRRVKSGETVETEPPSVDEWRNAFKDALDGGHDVFAITISSQTSKSYERATSAATGLGDRVSVFDSRAAGGLETLYAIYASELAKAGKSAREIAQLLTPQNLKSAGFFAVPNMSVLARSGRVPKAIVALGSMLGVSLVLKMSDDGSIAPAGQSRSFDKTIEIMVDAMVRAIERAPGAWVAISHVQASELATRLSSSLRTKLGHVPVREFMHETTPTIATNIGEGAVGIFAIVP